MFHTLGKITDIEMNIAGAIRVLYFGFSWPPYEKGIKFRETVDRSRNKFIHVFFPELIIGLHTNNRIRYT